MSKRGRGKPHHKGRRRQFTDEEALKVELEKERRNKEWREMKGEIPSDSDEEKEEAKAEATPTKPAASNDLPPSGSSSEDEEGEEKQKPKGVGGLIEIENPNRAQQKLKKVSEIGEVQLSRREREEIAKQQAKARYQKLHAEGKTDQAKADLARLAIIRKQRDDAAKRREQEKQAKDAATAAKAAAKKR